MNKRVQRHKKIRQEIFGTKDCPRLAVFKSSKHIYAQIIDDSLGKTLVSLSDMKISNVSKVEKALGEAASSVNSKKSRAYQVGKKLASIAAKFKIKTVVFDRGGFLYHGRVAEVARGAREGGLKF